MGHMQFREQDIQLPSSVKGYENLDLPFINGDTLTVSHWTMAHKRELQGMESQDLYTMFRTLMKTLIVEPKSNQWDIDKLLMSDALVICYAVKYKSYGDDFSLDYYCPVCIAEQHFPYKITNLEVKLHSEIEDYQANGILINLDKYQVTCHLPRLEDEKLVIAEVKKMQKMKMSKSAVVDGNIMRLAQLIDTIDGKSFPLMEKFQFLLKLDPEYIDALGDFIVESDTGIVHRVPGVTCTNCGADNSDTVVLGVTPSFFRGVTKRISKISRPHDPVSQTREPVVAALGDNDSQGSPGSL